MAAEVVVSQVVEQLTCLLIKQGAEQVDLLIGVEGKLENLAKTFKRIQAVLADADQRKTEEKAVQLWLQDLEDVSYEIDDVLDEWNYMILKKHVEGTSSSHGKDGDAASTSIDLKQWVRSFFMPSSCFCCTQVVMRRKIGLKIKEINERLDIIEKDADRLHFISNSSTTGVASKSPHEWRPAQTTSFVDESEVVGRKGDQNKLVSQLLDEKTEAIQILCLVGTGGIGKTTLAQLVYKDDRVKGHFEKRGWVCVSDPFDEIRITKAILESFESKSSDLNELDSLLQKISESISGKKFFLVFDDVWTEDEMRWTSLKASLKRGAPGSVILLTTRNEMVARAAGVTSQIPLGVLSEEDSWSLFYQVALSSHTQHECEKLSNIGREIAKKCEGLPLALRIIGSFLRYKTNVEEWQKVLDSKLWDLQETKMKVFRHLYLSYNELPSSLRPCFSYCAVFPKDKRIKVDDLVRQWMAQGYLNLSGSENEIEVYGRKCFENLAMRSFFQDCERDKYDQKITYCKMHDIVHDFAQHLSERECLTIEEGKKGTFLGNPRHITWLGVEQAPSSLPDCKMGQARSFFVADTKLDTHTTRQLLNNLKLVRVLSLYECELQELPGEIGTLIHLRYLDLSRNRSLTQLPEIVYNLYNLQTLDLEGCSRLQELPPGIEKLKMLRHLIFGGRLKFPKGIGELTELRTLPPLEVGRNSYKLSYLKNLNQLQGSLEVGIFGDLDDTEDVHNADLKSKEHIKKLELWFADSCKNVAGMEALEPPPNLHELELMSYGGTSLPTGIASLNNLTELLLDSCNRLTSLHPLARLPSLEKLEISNFDQLKSVGSAFWGIRESSPPSLAIGFPKLMELEFYGCENWESWEEENDFDSLMPRLHRLVIRHCSKLKALPRRFLRRASSLKCIELEDDKFNASKFLLAAEKLAQVKAGQTNHQTTSTVSNGEPQVKEAAHLLDSRDEEELKSALWLLCRNKNDEIQAIIEAGLFGRLVDLLRHPQSRPVMELTLKAIAQIAERDDIQKQAVIEHGILPHLLNLLTYDNASASTEIFACEIISSIAAGNKDQIQAVIDAGLFGVLFRQCGPFSAAAKPIINAIRGGSDEQINFFVSQGCAEALRSCSLRIVLHEDFGIAWLEGVEKILKVGEEVDQKNNQLGGNTTTSGDDHRLNNPFKLLIQKAGVLEAIERCKFHHSGEIREKAAEILTRYWPEGAVGEKN